jgi:hypothetical protein
MEQKAILQWTVHLTFELLLHQCHNYVPQKVAVESSTSEVTVSNPGLETKISMSVGIKLKDQRQLQEFFTSRSR